MWSLCFIVFGSCVCKCFFFTNQNKVRDILVLKLFVFLFVIVYEMWGEGVLFIKNHGLFGAQTRGVLSGPFRSCLIRG